MLTPLLHGLVLAFGLIIPLGPQNVFIFTQGATQPRLRDTAPVVAAAALSDTLLISLAVLGVSAAVLAVPWLKIVLVSVGVCFLLYAGWMAWRTPADDAARLAQEFTPARRVLIALAFSLLNPHAILDTIGVIGTSSLAYAGPQKLAFAAACVAVSWMWFSGLALTGRIVESVVGLRRVLGRLSAVAMWASAAYLAWMTLAGPLANA